MKRIQRLSLSSQVVALLRKRSDTVAAAAKPAVEAGRLWEMQDNKAFREVREVLGRMATGLERCMYCEDSEGTAIEHFWPRSSYPHRAFDWLNYLLACSRCNSNFKRDQFPLDESGLPLLINPTDEEPLDHLAFSPLTGKYNPFSVKGEHSVRVFGLDRYILERGRRNAWVSLGHLLVSYGTARKSGEEGKAERLESALREQPFAGVLAALLRIAAGPDADLLVEPECLQVLQNHPEIGTWA